MALVSRTNKYAAPFFLALAGAAAIASPLFLKLGNEIPEYLAQEEYINSQKRMRAELQERKKTSDKIRKTGLVLSASTLTLTNYLDNKKHLPTIRKTDLNRYRKEEKVWVYDASDQCIGYINNRTFTSKYHDTSACKNLPLKTNGSK